MSFPIFKVRPTAHVKQRIKDIGKKAKTLGIFAETAVHVLQIVDNLENDPIGWGTMVIHRTNPELIECFRYYESFSLHYLVYEQPKIVEVVSLEPIPHHTLAQP